MGAIGDRRQASFTRHINSRGTDTTVNGSTIKALWQDAGFNRIQTFLDQSEWATSSFEVRFPSAVLSAPYSLANGMEITRQGSDWRCVARNITLEESDGTIVQVNCLAVLATQ